MEENLASVDKPSVYPQIWVDIPRECSYTAILPNLLYKNGKIIFNSKTPIKIKKDNVISFEKSFIISYNTFNFNITCNYIQLNYFLNY